MAYQQGQQATWYNGQTCYELGQSVSVSCAARRVARAAPLLNQCNKLVLNMGALSQAKRPGAEPTIMSDMHADVTTNYLTHATIEVRPFFSGDLRFKAL